MYTLSNNFGREVDFVEQVNFSKNAKNAPAEIWYPFPISGARGHLFSIKHGFVPIPIAATTLKSGTAIYISTNL